MSLVDERLRCLASPDRARSLLTVRAAISSATSSDRPRSSSPSLMCSYCRSLLLLHARCGIRVLLHSLPDTYPGGPRIHAGIVSKAMRYVDVGGAKMSAIGLGCWQFGS